MPTTIAEIFARYLARFPDEAAFQHAAAELFSNFPHAAVIDRKNFAGHITASALVIHREKKHAVLIKHKTLERWLQPGGHVEPADASPLDAALRELLEEVGIAATQVTLVPPAPGLQLVPTDIDSHPIPANPRKSEPAHTHHDFRYLFLASDTRLATDLREVDDCRWFHLDDAPTQQAFPRLLAKARAMLDV